MSIISRSQLFRSQASPGLHRSSAPAGGPEEPADTMAGPSSSRSGISWGNALGLAGMGALSVVVSACGVQQQPKAARSPSEQIRALEAKGEFFEEKSGSMLEELIFHSGGGGRQVLLSSGSVKKAVLAGETVQYRTRTGNGYATASNPDELRALAGDGEKLAPADAAQLQSVAQSFRLRGDKGTLNVDQAQDRVARGLPLRVQHTKQEFVLNSLDEVRLLGDIAGGRGPYTEARQKALLDPHPQLSLGMHPHDLARALAEGRSVEVVYQPRYGQASPTRIPLKTLDDLVNADNFARAAARLNGVSDDTVPQSEEAADRSANWRMQSSLHVLEKQSQELADKGDAVGQRALEQTQRLRRLLQEAKNVNGQGIRAEVRLDRTQLDEMQAPILEMFRVHGAPKLGFN